LLIALIGDLVGYQEEGVELSPTILVTDNIATVCAFFPGSVYYEVGSAALGELSAKRVLKDCAPLTSENWHIYVQRDSRLRYGVFSYSRLPTTLPLEDAISLSAGLAILAKKVDRSAVDLVGGKGSRLHLSFSTTREEYQAPVTTTAFANACCAELTNPDPDFATYLSRCVDDALYASHGTILVCVNGNAEDVEGLADFVPVNPALDFYSGFAAYRSSDRADVLVGVQRAEELLRGFAQCDGILVFNQTAQVIAYRAFYNAPAAGAEGISGGARRRAFEGLKSKLGSGLTAILFRSQDGLTIYEEVQA
jgi:hypothetical protein